MRLESRLKHKVQSCQPRKQISVKQYSQIFTPFPSPDQFSAPKKNVKAIKQCRHSKAPLIRALEGPYKVSVLTGCRLSCHVVKDKKKLTFNQNKKSKEIKEDINFVKQNISNLNKAVIPRTKSAKDSQIAHLSKPCRAFSK